VLLRQCEWCVVVATLLVVSEVSHEATVGTSAPDRAVFSVGIGGSSGQNSAISQGAPQTPTGVPMADRRVDVSRDQKPGPNFRSGSTPTRKKPPNRGFLVARPERFELPTFGSVEDGLPPAVSGRLGVVDLRR
jgi:hypothetical protein